MKYLKIFIVISFAVIAATAAARADQVLIRLIFLCLDKHRTRQLSSLYSGRIKGVRYFGFVGYIYASLSIFFINYF